MADETKLTKLEDNSLNIAGGAGDDKPKPPKCSKCGKEMPPPPHGFHHKHPPKFHDGKGHPPKLKEGEQLLCPECRDAEKASK